MCLAVPGRVESVREDRGTLLATVDFDGVRKEICLAYLPETQVGQYVIVHVGFAISIIDEVSALEALQTFRDLRLLEEGERDEVAAEHGSGAAG